MPKNADEKRIKILEAAKKRFAHYGMAKTTMAEIAKDLVFSKALLYYYFPDKNSLYCAVLEYIIEEFDEEIRGDLDQIVGTEEAILFLLDRRMDFVKKYYYMLEFSILSSKEVNNDLNKIIANTFEMHRQGIKQIFEKGVGQGELKSMDTEEISKIFLFSTMGMRMMVMKDLSTDFIPSKEEFDYIILMQKKMAKIFITGLRA